MCRIEDSEVFFDECSRKKIKQNKEVHLILIKQLSTFVAFITLPTILTTSSKRHLCYVRKTWHEKGAK